MRAQIVKWPMTSRDPRRCCEAVRSGGYPSDSLASFFVDTVWRDGDRVGIDVQELGGQMSKCLKFCTMGLKFKTDFHSKNGHLET